MRFTTQDIVPIGEARKLGYYHTLEVEHPNRVLLQESERALREILAGSCVSNQVLMKALS